MCAAPAAASRSSDECTPLHWWTRADLQRIAQTVRSALQAWATDWELSAAAATAWNACDEPHAAPRELRWSGPDLAGPVSEAAWIGAAGRPPVAWLHERCFGGPDTAADACSPGTITSELARRALGELQQVLARACDLPLPVADAGAQDVPQAPSTLSRPWSGAVNVQLAFGSSSGDALWLHLPRALATRLAGAADRANQATPCGALAPITAALARASVRLRVELSPVPLNLGGVLGLRVGDVIATSHRLDAPLHVGVVPGKAPAGVAALCRGQLGARRGCLAIALEPRLS